ncbi:hypothetical protein NSZ01_34660 [Nocardioides szechwanensis]|nr:hypothetical protein NSZ01_34660 [Nocardioides szechwanensis]
MSVWLLSLLNARVSIWFRAASQHCNGSVTGPKIPVRSIVDEPAASPQAYAGRGRLGVGGVTPATTLAP